MDKKFPGMDNLKLNSPGWIFRVAEKLSVFATIVHPAQHSHRISHVQRSSNPVGKLDVAVGASRRLIRVVRSSIGPRSQDNTTRNSLYRSVVDLLGTVRSIKGEEGDRIWNLIKKKYIILKKLNLDFTELFAQVFFFFFVRFVVRDFCWSGCRQNFFLLYLGGLWGQRPIKKWRPTRLCSKKTKRRMELPEGFACPLPLQWGRFQRRGDGSFQVIWRTDLEVDLERTQNYCVKLLSLYLRRIII